MQDGGKNPLQWTLETWYLAIGMGVAGGIVNNYKRYRKVGKFSWFFLLECILDATVSGFVSLVVFMAMQSFDQPLSFSAAIAGVAGHRATRLVFFTEKMTEHEFKKLEKKFEIDKDEE